MSTCVSGEYQKGYMKVASEGSLYYPVEGEITSRLSEGWASGRWRLNESSIGMQVGAPVTISFVRGTSDATLYYGEASEVSEFDTGKEHYYEVVYDGEGRKLDWYIATLSSGIYTESSYLSTVMSFCPVIESSIAADLAGTITKNTSPGLRMVWEEVTQFCSDRTIDFLIADHLSKIFFFHAPFGTISGTFVPLITRNKTKSIRKLKNKVTLYNTEHVVNDNNDWFSESTIYLDCFSSQNYPPTTWDDGTVMLFSGLPGRARDYSVVCRATVTDNYAVWISLNPGSIISNAYDLSFKWIPVVGQVDAWGITNEDKATMNIYISSSLVANCDVPSDNYLVCRHPQFQCMQIGTMTDLANITEASFKKTLLKLKSASHKSKVNFETVGTWNGDVRQVIFYMRLDESVYRTGIDINNYGKQETPADRMGLILDEINFRDMAVVNFEYSGSTTTFGTRMMLPTKWRFDGSIGQGSIDARNYLADLWKPEDSAREIIIPGTYSPYVGYVATFNCGGSSVETYLLREVTHTYDGDDWKSKLVGSNSRVNDPILERLRTQQRLLYGYKELEQKIDRVSDDTNFRELDNPILGKPSNYMTGTVWSNSMSFGGVINSIGVINNISSFNVANIGIIGTIGSVGSMNITSLGTIDSIAYIGQMTAGTISAIGSMNVDYADIGILGEIDLAEIGIANVTTMGNVTNITAGIITTGALQVDVIENLGILSVSSATIGSLSVSNELVGNFVISGNNIEDLSITAEKIGNLAIVSEKLANDAIQLYDATGKLKAYFPFDEGSGSYVWDWSGNNLQGVITSAWWTTAGKFDDALGFMGVGGVSIDPGTVLNFNHNTFSVSAWFTIDDTLATDKPIVARHNLFHIRANGNDAHFYIYDGNDWEPHVSWNGLAVGEWYNIIATYGYGQTLRLYINGDLKAETVNALAASYDDELEIGQAHAWGQYFSGKIDEVRIYQTELDADEALSTYRKGPYENMKVSAHMIGDFSGATIENLQVITGVNMNFDNATITNLDINGGTILNANFGQVENLNIVDSSISTLVIGTLASNGVIGPGNLIAGAIQAQHILADVIQSTHLTSEWITAKSFRTAGSGARIEFNASYLRGLNSSGVAQFSLSAVTGKAYCGGTNVVFSSDGIGVNANNCIAWFGGGQAVGYINANSSSEFRITGASAGKYISMYSYGPIFMSANGGAATVSISADAVIPNDSAITDLGLSDRYWNYVHASSFVDHSPLINVERPLDSLMQIRKSSNGKLDKRSLHQDLLVNMESTIEAEVGVNIGNCIQFLMETSQELYRDNQLLSNDVSSLRLELANKGVL